jgi:hypothetical protein
VALLINISVKDISYSMLRFERATTIPLLKTRLKQDETEDYSNRLIT